MARKSSKRFGISFEGFDELMERYKRLGGDLKKVSEDCLKAAHETVTPRLHTDLVRHRRTGRTESVIKDKAEITWESDTASVGVGFSLPQGLASIFLMYGTPRVKKDAKLYNDIYGTQVQKEIFAKQEKILRDAISRKMEG